MMRWVCAGSANEDFFFFLIPYSIFKTFENCYKLNCTDGNNLRTFLQNISRCNVIFAAVRHDSLDRQSLFSRSANVNSRKQLNHLNFYFMVACGTACSQC